MAKKIALTLGIILAAILLQSAVLSRLVPRIYAVPDIALCVLVFSAYVNGMMTGQLTGFFSGLMLDFLSSSPLGLNAFIRTLLGALGGFLKDTFYLDIVFLPMALCAGATLLKAALLFPLHLLFADAVPSYNLLGIVFWIELAMNTILAPFLFALLKLIGPLVSRQKEGA